jgi:hypothetical protein
MSTAQIFVIHRNYTQSSVNHSFLFSMYGTYSNYFYFGTSYYTDTSNIPEFSYTNLLNNNCLFSINYYTVPIQLGEVTNNLYYSNNSTSLTNTTYPSLVTNQLFIQFITNKCSFNSYTNYYFFIITCASKPSTSTIYNTSLYTSTSLTSGYTKRIDTYGQSFVHGKSFSVSTEVGTSHKKSTNSISFTDITTSISIDNVFWIKYLEVFYINSDNNVYVTTDYVNFNILFENSKIFNYVNNSYIYMKDSRYFWNFLDRNKKVLITNSKLINNKETIIYNSTKNYYILKSIFGFESFTIDIF